MSGNSGWDLGEWSEEERGRERVTCDGGLGPRGVGRAATVCGVERRETLACLRRLEACLLPPFGTAFTPAFALGLSDLLSRLPS